MSAAVSYSVCHIPYVVYRMFSLITLNLTNFSGSTSKTEAIEFQTKKEKWITEKFANKCLRTDAINISFQYSIERHYKTDKDKF